MVNNEREPTDATEALREIRGRGGLARYMAYQDALRALANWSLPRWEPDNPQTEGEEMRLFAMRVLGGHQ